jgi:hypothetical protein
MDQRNQQKQQAGGGQQKPSQQQQPKQNSSQTGTQQNEEVVDKKLRDVTESRPEQRDQQKERGGQGGQQAAHLTPDQISFYDETLKKQIEGSYRTDGKAVHVSSVKYGIKSAPYGSLGTFIDQYGLDLLAQKLLSELARDSGSGLTQGAKMSDQRNQQNQQGGIGDRQQSGSGQKPAQQRRQPIQKPGFVPEGEEEGGGEAGSGAGTPSSI